MSQVENSIPDLIWWVTVKYKQAKMCKIPSSCIYKVYIKHKWVVFIFGSIPNISCYSHTSYADILKCDIWDTQSWALQIKTDHFSSQLVQLFKGLESGQQQDLSSDQVHSSRLRWVPALFPLQPGWGLNTPGLAAFSQIQCTKCYYKE